MIVIGADTHKRSYSFAAVDAATGELRGDETARATGAAHEQLLACARAAGQERVWAIEDCRHVSAKLERFLIARGERVVRVPPHSMAGRRRGLRQPGKSDPIDALAVARAALEEGVDTLPVATPDGPSREIKLLLDHREDLVEERTRIQCRLRWLLHDRCPELPGIGALTAAKLIAEIAGIERFKNPAKLARLAGIAPIPASSGNHQRVRLHRGGNRQINAAVHRIAVTQMRMHPPAIDYIARKMSEGKSKREAMRCLKSHLIRTIYKTMAAPAEISLPTPLLT